MQTLEKLSDAQLLIQTRDIARKEQSYSLALIEHLLEVDARKLYATRGYDSLFKYVVKDLGYSESTAYERIRAMRLVRLVPEVREQLKSGALTLTAAAQVESFRRRENLPNSEVSAIVEEAAHKSLHEVEVLLLSRSDNPIPREKLRQITPELQEAKLILTPELQRLILRYEELHGKVPVSQILQTVLTAHLKRHDPLQRLERSEPPNEAIEESASAVSVSAKPCVTPTGHSRYVATNTKLKLWRRAQGQCEWVDLKTHSRCSSRYRLQNDHYPRPFALGGPSTYENLRLVCPAHNARFAVDVFGVERVQGWRG